MQLLKQETTDLVFLSEEGLAKGMTSHVLARFAVDGSEETAKAH